MTHELSLLSGLLDRVEAIALEHRAPRVVAVRVRLGALAHISPDHLREHFRHATRSGVARGARLEVTASNDLDDPHAQDILLESVELETAD
jgi:hydrogenase nickel incorporation protein HypA/HybF